MFAKQRQFHDKMPKSPLKNPYPSLPHLPQAMAKLHCPICNLSTFPPTYPNHSGQASKVTQQQISAHLLSTHNHNVTPQNESWYRQLQTRRWEAQDEALDLKLRQNTRDKRIKWEAFAGNSWAKDVPSSEGMEEGLVREMVWLNEVGEDSDGEGGGDREVDQTREVGTVAKESVERKMVDGSSDQRSRPSDRGTASNHGTSSKSIERDLKRQRRKKKRRAVRKDLAAFRRFHSGD